MEKISLLYHQLFSKDLSDKDAAGFLGDIVNEHPYFAPAQFFLLQITPAAAPDFQRQLSKAALHFNNNYWLNYLLYETDEPDQPDEFLTAPEATNESAEEQPFITAGEMVTETPMPVFEQEEKMEIIPETYTTSYSEQPAASFTETSTETAAATAEEAFVNETELPPLAAQEQPDAQPLNIQLALSDTKEDSIAFEPLHTTDYFASVGIKLSEEVKPADKLGHQLKSFTEWLKTMKKIHAKDEEAVIKEQTETDIRQLAEKSNVNGDVVTEAMADVLIQQGRKEKAVQMLEKLSLLNPVKSVFFAAKIKNLKEQ